MEREIHNEDIVSQCLIQAGICFLLSRWMVFRLHAGSELVNVAWLSLLLFAAVHLIFGVMKEELSVKGKVMTCSGSGFLTASAIFRILLRNGFSAESSVWNRVCAADDGACGRNQKKILNYAGE